VKSRRDTKCYTRTLTNGVGAGSGFIWDSLVAVGGLSEHDNELSSGFL
jgi:hypothetical protein